MMSFLPIKKIHPDEVKDIKLTSSERSNTIFMSIFEEKDMVESVSESTTFNLQEYYNYPERYRSKFEMYINHLSILINASFWDTAYPRHVTKKSLKKLFLETREPSLRVIGDISCDVHGGIECTVKATDPGNPVFAYDPVSENVVDGFDKKGLVIMAVDNLPSELSRDASIYFSSVLRDYIPALVKTDFSADYKSLDLPYPLKKAIIVYKGELTSEYLYLKDYL
jgi:alpha-aminoadipic semialdehyde synthase